MRSGTLIRGAASTAWLAVALMQTVPVHGDEPSRLGRLFRFGSANDASKPVSPLGMGSGSGMSSGGPGANSSNLPPFRPPADPYTPPALSTPPTTTITAGTGGSLAPAPRITPKPRVTKAVTEADPLVTRLAIGRAEGGSQFGMFMQVFADGTVIDGEGVHKVGPDALKPVVEAVSGNDFSRVKGHCGGPAGDTFETIHVVTYERAYGRLRANSFSYSGNPQGCDHAVHNLHKVLEDLQMKLSTPGIVGGGNSANLTPTVVAPPLSSSPASAPAMTPLPAPVPMAGPSSMAMPNLPDPGLH